ncbi:MAG: choline/carnitine/betaine transport [Halieaceae bacterium]|jgi:choline/carnitine/betaine transport
MTNTESDSQPVPSLGFYHGYNKSIALSAKIIVALLIFWAISVEEAADLLVNIQQATISNFGSWYIYVTAFFLFTCLALAIVPSTGKINLGKPGEKPEFSNFAWFSMMFSAGIGVGMLTYSTAEPISHFANNPDVIRGFSTALSSDNVANAFKWALLHYGLTPWGCYGIAGMSLAYFSYNRGLPLTIRSPLTAVLGKSASGPLGDVVDTAAIFATIIGVGVTIGYGVTQFAYGLHKISGFSWMLSADGKPSIEALLFVLFIVMSASILSARSGVVNGIRWLSNINMSLSVVMLGFFVVFGSTLFSLQIFFEGIWNYLIALPSMSLTVWKPSVEPVNATLAQWQGDWTIFTFAWWISFTPFVGLFLCRVSRGRTIREYVLGAMIVPSMMCLTWFCFVGGTAVYLELTGVAKGMIVNSDISAQLFATVDLLLSPGMAIALSCLIVVLLLTYLVTSADSAILVIDTIASEGSDSSDSSHRGKHIIVWGAIITTVIAVLLVAGGIDALRSVMIIGALPFTLVMVLMAVALIKSLLLDKIIPET